MMEPATNLLRCYTVGYNDYLSIGRERLLATIHTTVVFATDYEVSILHLGLDSRLRGNFPEKRFCSYSQQKQGKDVASFAQSFSSVSDLDSSIEKYVLGRLFRPCAVLVQRIYNLIPSAELWKKHEARNEESCWDLRRCKIILIAVIEKWHITAFEFNS